SKEWVKGYLNEMNILKYFDTIRTGDDVLNTKPDPEVYLKALQDLDCNPKNALAFEDSLNGCKAAKSAGLFCVIIPNSITEKSPFTNHDLRLSSMAEKSFDYVLSHINKMK